MKPSDSNSLLHALREFGRNPVTAGRELRDALHTDNSAFLAALLNESGLDTSDRGFRYAMILLLHNDVLIPAITNPDVTTFDQALRLTRCVLQMDSNFINSMLTAVLMRPDLIKKPVCALRVLDIVRECVDHLANWRSITRIHQSGDARIKTRCAELIAQYRFEDPAGLARFCRADPRVRANIIEMLWTVDKSRATALLEAATQDGSNRVAGNAWLALYSEGNAKCLARLVAMLESSDPKQQVTAAWVMGQTHDARFGGRLLEASRSDLPELRKTAFAGLSRLDPIPKPDSDPPAPGSDDVAVSFVTAPQTEGYELWLRVADLRDEAIPNIKSVDFFVWAGEEPITDYSIEELSYVRNAALAIVYPADSPVLVRAIKDSIATKAQGHYWALNAYGPPTSAARSDDYPRFEANLDALATVFESGPALSATADAAIRSVLSLDPKLPDRHLVLILSGLEHDPDPQAIRSLCREKGFHLHCWRFRDGVPETRQDSAREIPNAKVTGSKPAGARRFWETDDDMPHVVPARDPRDPDTSSTRPSSVAPEQRPSLMPGVVRDEAQSASYWPSLVASLSSRYVLRTQIMPTAVAIRKAGTKPPRFSTVTRLLKGASNG